jgi:FixJ family two-component response regulator
MIPEAIEVRLKPKERAELEARLRAATTEQRQLLRIRIVLEAAEGWGTREIARELDTTPTTVSLRRGRFARGLGDLPTGAAVSTLGVSPSTLNLRNPIQQSHTGSVKV